MARVADLADPGRGDDPGELQGRHLGAGVSVIVVDAPPGGGPKLHRHPHEEVFYRKVLADPLLKPLFGEGRATHVDRLTAFTAESFGGPDRFSRELGFGHLIDVHRRLGITEGQRRRFVGLYMEAFDEAGMPDDEAFRSHVELGSGAATRNSHAETDEELHPLREVPRWGRQGDR